ncbi:arsenite efflux ATP-binding protein ArsA [Thermosporothrix hazakensis]|jgi:arsenite-transporting ATPase|uniref:arsenite-transporting ATPase n=2 Tax=Thermosporothrix TaxID=768650 RepID=A0A326UF83_THEHA|nr:ArsA family ATPase [Thermosporothrix hazakensis]PZW36575.1 arsenite efflux ATP-binding protein ArsA [Thermosporothrix hazakensis]BBH89043.1 arsenic-transporting ATPase [Thermosporothrix sp. COM3]GCE47227.1 arsenic-transporting ATPase [Thermosporothrix hazakensis]
MRIILYLGKGGVGKTTISAATAARSAALGKRTLVVSTDLAHSLADCFQTTLTNEPQQLAPNLYAQEVNVLDEMRRGWGKLQEKMANALRKQGMDDVIAEELALVPGMDEIVSLVNIYRNAQQGNFEVVVIDAAPTGETVRLLSMPDTFQWYVNRISGLQSVQNALSFARPFIKKVLPSTEIMTEVQRLSERVQILREVLSNPDISSYRPVVNPERMVIKEALRAETYLALFGYPIDSVMCNRVLQPGTYQDAFMQEMFQSQEKLRTFIHDTFSPLPVWEAPYYPREILGVDALTQLAQEIFGEEDPTRVFHRGPVQEIVRQGESYVLRLPLPHIEMNKVVMTKKGDEIIIEIGNFKREITLPSVLAHQEATRARLANNALEIHFTAPAEASDKSA